MEIRIARPEDAAAFLEIYAPVVRQTSISFEEEVPSEAEMGRRIEDVLPRYPWLAAVEGDDVLGYAYATTHRTRAAYRWSPEVSAYVHAGARRRGVGRALYSTLFAILEKQRFCRAFAGITLPNDPSVRLHEAVGFRPLGVFHAIGYKAGTWHDVGWWERDLAVPEGAPDEPIPFAELRAAKEVSALLATATF
jgi:phosphinothricin acetyltransferase